MKYCVLGAGLMGRAIAYDLLNQKDTTQVILCDKDVRQLKDVKALHAMPKQLQTEILDITHEKTKLEKMLQDMDVMIAAVHYKYNLDLTKLAIKTKTHMCDLGGNSEIVDEQLKLNEDAKKAGVSIIPDCGLAPGMVSVLVKWGVEKFKWCDTVKIRVGGLPENPNNKLKYERLFSVDGLINEYVEPVRILRNGEIEIVKPLAEIENIEFLGVGKLESFTTSGGTSTLIETYKNHLKNLDYKTIRYKGHLKELKKIRKENFKKAFSALPICKKDITLVKIIFEGGSKKKELSIIDSAVQACYGMPVTSMMRMTAFPASIIAQMLAREQIKEKGVLPQEKCVDDKMFISELKKRGIIFLSFT